MTTTPITCQSHFDFLARVADELPQYAGWIEDHGLQRGRVAPGSGVGDHWFAGSDWVCRTYPRADGGLDILEVRGQR